jgi:hypothetical protein
MKKIRLWKDHLPSGFPWNKTRRKLLGVLTPFWKRIKYCEFQISLLIEL